MTGKIYYQWQNPVLRETIYPARDMKLRHFLLYYYEIDLWARYKHKKDWSIDKFPKEKAEFLAAQKKAITDAYNSEVSLKAYFRDDVPEVFAKAGNEDNEDLRKLNQLLGNLRRDFRAFFKMDEDEEEKQPATTVSEQHEEQDEASEIEKKSGKQLMGDLEIQRSRDRKEKIFVAMRVSEWERHLKELKRKLSRKQTIIEYSNPKPNNLHRLEADRDTLRDIVVPRMQMELDKLKELVAAQNKLEKRKQEFSSRIAKKILERDEILKDLFPKRQELGKWEAKKREYEREFGRVTNRPSIADVMQFLAVDVYSKIDDYLTQANTHLPIKDAVRVHVRNALGGEGFQFFEEFLNVVKQWLEKNQPSASVDASWVVQQIHNLSARFVQAEKKLDLTIASLESGLPSMRAEAHRKTGQEKTIVERQIGDRLQLIGILSDSKLRELLRAQWDKFDELQYALRLAFPSGSAVPERTPDDVKRDLSKAVKNLSAAKKAAAVLEKQLDEITDALCVKREKYLKEFMLERKLTLRDDILPFLAEKYYAELLKLKHDALLLKVFQRFWDEPERFPPWLQYMVIHFSGMRYASAHGSWADPRDLLLNLRTSDIQDQIENEVADIKTKGLLEASCQARLEVYGPLKEPVDASGASSLPEDARAAAQDSRFIKRFQGYYKAQLHSSFESKRSKAYVDLRIDEEGCEILAMKNEDVLEELTNLHNVRKFPEWMWKEIVKLTDLRLTEVDSRDWETLTPQEQTDRLHVKDKQLAQYREIMNEWKSKHLTGWRQEHERSNRLIVTRAVCNEVAEHVQHLRGHVSAAGLTQKPFWYKGAEDRYFEAKEKEGRSSKAGKRKSDPRPYFVRARDRGEDLHTFEVGASILWLRFVNDSPNEWRIAKPMATREGDELIDAKYCGRKHESGNWVYTMGEPTSRSRQRRDHKGALLGPRETQYLRWMHEATVATVADTAEGKVVLTFETALPYEDPSLSTIGVFKRYLKDLNHDQGEDAYNPAFVGFMPEKTLSADDMRSMEEMLDWNHILLQDVVTPAQLEKFREKYIRNRKPPAPTVRFVKELKDDKPRPVMALKPLKEYEAWIDKLAADPKSNLFRVKKWGDIRKGELDVNVVGTSNFQAVSLYNDKTGFGAVSNYIYILRDDIDRLAAMQVEDQYEHKRKDWLVQKMVWLCQHRGSIYMFDDEEDSWQRSARIRWGTLVLGGNLVQVSGFRQVKVKVKGKKVVRDMAVLAGFRKSDWSRPLDELLAEGLVHRCFCAYKNNQFGDSPQGIVYSPFYSLLDWDFAGKDKPRELYIPVEDIYKPEVQTDPSSAPTGSPHP